MEGRAGNGGLLVWGATRVGDAVMTIPALKLLRQHLPQRRITYVSSPFAEGVLRLDGLCDHLLSPPRRGLGAVFAYRGLRRDVRAGRFAPVFVFAHATHYRKRIGGCAPVFAPDLSPTASGHTAERTARAVLRALSLPEEETPAPTVDVPEDPAAVERLRGLGVALEHDRFLLVHAGSNRVTRRASHRHRHEKRWPLASFLAVADRVLEAFPDAKVVLVGTREEGRWMAPELAERGDRHGRLVDLCGETAISDLLQLLRRAALLLCNDSGVMHLASVVRTPLVALFGPTDEGLIGPFRMEDRACLIRALPFEDALEHHDCMERIAVERVYDEVARRLP